MKFHKGSTKVFEGSFEGFARIHVLEASWALYGFRRALTVD